MKRLNRFGMSLAVISALSFGFTGCGSSSSDSGFSNSILAPFVYVSRGDVFGATVTDANGQVAVQVEGINKYEFETAIKYPVTAKGGYVDVNGDGKIEADVDIKLNIEMISYTDTLTPVTTYLADEADKAQRDLKLQELVDLVNELDAPSVTTEELLKSASDTTKEAQLAINAVYAELVDNTNYNTDFEIEDMNETLVDLEAEFKNSPATGEAMAVKIEEYIVNDLSIDTLTKDEVDEYTNSLKDSLTDFLDVDKVEGLLGETIYKIDKEANPITYTEFTLPADLEDELVEIESTTYELANGAWEEVRTTVEASIDGDELTIVTDAAGEVTTEVTEFVSNVNGVLTMETSFEVDGELNFSQPQTVEFHAEMTAEMKDPELLNQ